MQKIKIGHIAKFRDKANFFSPQVLFPVCVTLRCIFTSGVLHTVATFDRNLIHSADTCSLVMVCVGYARTQLHVKPFRASVKPKLAGCGKEYQDLYVFSAQKRLKWHRNLHMKTP